MYSNERKFGNFKKNHNWRDEAINLRKAVSQTDKSVADPGAWRPGDPGPPLSLLKLVKKKDGHCTGPQFSRLIAPPPSDKFLDPLL